MKKIQRVLSVVLSLLLIFVMALPLDVTAQAASAKKITSCKITVASSVSYTGKALKPKVTVKSGKTTLKNGTHYTVKYSSNKAIGVGKVTVTGISKKGYTGSKTLSFNIVPAAPTVSATSTSTTAKLTWKKVAGASKYTIYKYNASKKAYVKLAATAGTSYSIKDLKANSTSYYNVKAYTTSGKKTYTSPASKKVTVKTGPSKVTSLAATSTENSVKLTWKAVSGASSYTVYEYNSAKKTYSTLKSGVTATNYTISSLKASTDYKYAVAAYNKSTGKTGDKSAVVSVTTKSAFTAPAKVTGLRAIAYDVFVKLDWTAVSGATSYSVYRYDASKKTYTLIKSGIADNSYTVNNLKGNSTYKFAVCAVKTNGKKTATGAKSDIITVKTSAYLSNLESCYNLIRGGTFSIKCQLENMSPLVSVSNGKIAFEFNENFDGTKMSARIFYNTKDGKYYTLAKMEDTPFKFYMSMSESELNKEFGLTAEDFSAKDFINSIAPEKRSTETITKETQTIDGKTYTCETYLSKSGTLVSYYFYGGSLAMIKTISKGDIVTMPVVSLSKTVDSSVFSLPVAFPLGWINIS